MSGNEQSDLAIAEDPRVTRGKNVRKGVCTVIGAVVVVGGLALVGQLLHNEMFNRISGKVNSIEMPSKPANPNDEGDYTVHLVRADGDELVALCSQRLCYKLHPGDTISADLNIDTNRLTSPLTITNRP